MTSANEILRHWLRNACAMEVQSEDMLAMQAKRLHEYPELRNRLLEHFAETRWQRNLLNSCLEQMGAEPSHLRQTGARLLALGNGLLDMAASDEAVRSLVVTNAFEHMEVATYRAIVAAADVAIQPCIGHICESILHEEEMMAAWLDLHVADLTRRYVVKATLDPHVAWH